MDSRPRFTRGGRHHEERRLKKFKDHAARRKETLVVSLRPGREAFPPGRGGGTCVVFRGCTWVIEDRCGISDRWLEEAWSRVRFKKSLSTKWPTLHSLAIACNHMSGEGCKGMAGFACKDVTEFACKHVTDFACKHVSRFGCKDVLSGC
jgi:hypothetical protein